MFFRTLSSDVSQFASRVTMGAASAVHVVAQDSIAVVFGNETKDQQPSEAEKEAEFRMTLEEVYLTPLLDAGDDEQKSSSEDDSQVSFEEKEVSSFLESFRVEEKTEEIANLLRRHEVLRELFESLVPVEVPYKEFWERHYYRCDPVRIQKEWDFQRELDNKALDANLQMMKGIAGAPVKVVKVIAVAPYYVVKGVVGMPVNFLARHFSPSVTANQPPNVETSAQKGLRRGELDDLQLAIAASNHRIGILRSDLGDTRKKLEVTEYTSRSLEEELASAKAALEEKENHVQSLQSKIKEITISVARDDTSNTIGSTQVSGLDESANDEEDNLFSGSKSSTDPIIISSPTKEECSPTSVLRHVATCSGSKSNLAVEPIFEEYSDEEEEEKNTPLEESAWKGDEIYFDADVELLLM